MEIQNLDRIRFVTEHFNDLQGLRFGVPLGLITLGLGATAFPRTVLFVGAFLLALKAKRYYRRSFGVVERPADPETDLYPVSIFNLVGPISRLEGPEPVTPIARHLLVTMGLVAILFAYFQAVPANIVVHGDLSAGQPLRVVPEPTPLFASPWIKGYPNGGPISPPSMLRAVIAQSMYVLFGSCFLGVWLWRKRRWSQSHHLALAALLLGLAAAGTSLGFLARGDGEVAPVLAPFLPALVYPGVALPLCGAAMVLAGLLDHWQLVRVLGWPEAEEE